MRGAACLVALAALAGCRTWHEGLVRQNLMQTRFFTSDIPRSLAEVDALVHEREPGVVEGPCELCLVSAEDRPDGSKRYCFVTQGDAGCVVARAVKPTTTRFESGQVEVVPVGVVRRLWRLLDQEAASVANIKSEEEIEAIAFEEERRFEPKWTFTAGASTGAVVSSDPVTFTFGGQAGFRYWANYYLIPGATLHVENALQASRSFVTVALSGRAELSIWLEENKAFLNLPFLTFFMAAGPMVAFGAMPSAGARGVFGLQLAHLGRFYTPIFFELGFQSLRVDGESSSGFRVAIGLGL